MPPRVDHLDVVGRLTPSMNGNQEFTAPRSLVSQAGPSHWDVCSCWRDLILMISLRYVEAEEYHVLKNFLHKDKKSSLNRTLWSSFTACTRTERRCKSEWARVNRCVRNESPMFDFPTLDYFSVVVCKSKHRKGCRFAVPPLSLGDVIHLVKHA
jgi:hypothetical protein